MQRRSFSRYVWATRSGSEVRASLPAPVADSRGSGACVTFFPAQRYITARVGSDSMEKYNHHTCSHLPSATSHLAGRRDRVAVHGVFLLILGQKLTLFTPQGRPQGNVYQEMRSATNKYRKTILSVVRTAATLMNV